MFDPHDSGNRDISFAVPCVHRLRFTHDVFGTDQHVLADVLEASRDEPGEGSQPSPVQVPRVQFWLDECLAEARPDIKTRIRGFCRRYRDRITLVGNVQLVPGGEAVKNDIHILERMLKVFHAADLDRRSYVVVIGGGAVLDAVGFAAAIAHRGLRLVRLPTTTLGQADSGLGVKNGVNLFGKKNWLGSFAVPWAVINDTELLSTLGDRDYICGFAEAVKVSLLKDARFFDYLCDNAARIRARDLAVASPAIRASAQLHLDHIARGGDPFEAREARPLDFGHWSAHKLEAMSGFSVRHGEAVAIGLAIDTIYSALVHGLPAADEARILRVLGDLGFSLHCPSLCDTETLFNGMEEFRQHLGGRLTLTMLKGIGRPINVHEVDLPAMRAAIERVVAMGAATNRVADRP